jgi:hypothetical protein
VQALFLASPPGFSLLVSQTVLTALAYPLCVAISAGLMGVRMAAPGEEAGA